MNAHENEKVWVVCKNSEIFGPMSAVEIKGGLTNKELQGDDPVWRKGWTAWKRLQDIPMFAYECKQSPGANRALPEITIPDVDHFSSVILPKVSANEIRTHVNWSARRIAVVSGAAVVFGPLGAFSAAVLTAPSAKTQRDQQERDQAFIDPENR